MNALKHKGILIVPVVLVVVAIAVLIWQQAKPEPTILTGMVEVKEVDVASKIPGRIDTILVKKGQVVHKGQLLARLESKEIDAKVAQAKAVMEAAKAKWDMARHGARPEQKEAVEKLYLQAKHQYEFAKKTYDRVQQVYKDSVISAQKLDEVEFKYNAAKEQMEAAKAKYEMVLKGARKEEVRAAEALYHQAEGAYREALAYRQETRLVSPLEGRVQELVADQGEIIAAGYPIITLIQPQDAWIVLQLREDQMNGLKIGQTFQGAIPALNNLKVTFKVDYIAQMADFATWRATNQKGDFDLKTFEIHLRPVKPINGLRAGMTVRIEYNIKNTN